MPPPLPKPDEAGWAAAAVGAPGPADPDVRLEKPPEPCPLLVGLFYIGAAGVMAGFYYCAKSAEEILCIGSFTE